MKQTPLSVKILPTMLLVSLAATGVVRAEVALASVFQDHAVLQRDARLPVWGTAAPGEKVTVSYAGQSQSAVADAAGKWTVTLEPMPVGKAGDFTAVASNTITLKDVVTGEVWVCSGQSNMAMQVGGVSNKKKEIAEANHPDIRLFKAPFKKTVKAEGKPDTIVEEGGKWDVCSPETVGAFTATGYFFGRSLNEKLKVPVGLISGSVGGTPIGQWVTKGGLYRKHIAPVVPYAIRGAIWYQGEANAQPSPLASSKYDLRLVELVEGWRKEWGYDFPFAWVQLPNFQKRQTEPVEELSLWAPMRETMWKAKRIPKTGMAVTIDLGGAESASLHPANKQDVGARLAQWALADVYGDKTAVASGPLMKSHSIKGGEVVIEFDYTNGGLVQKGDSLKSFAICGEDKKWVWADARIDGEKVIVSSASVPAPVAVRYGWAQNPIASLYNGAGQPASPFRTDDFPLSAEKPEVKVVPAASAPASAPAAN